MGRGKCKDFLRISREREDLVSDLFTVVSPGEIGIAGMGDLFVADDAEKTVVVEIVLSGNALDGGLPDFGIQFFSCEFDSLIDRNDERLPFFLSE